MRKITTLLIAAICLFSFADAFAADGFPGRKKYPKVPYIELADLAKQFKDVVVVYKLRQLNVFNVHFP